MANFLCENKKSIILETNYVLIEFSKKDAKVLSVTQKSSGKSVMGEKECFFFTLFDKDANAIPTKSVSLKNNTFVVETKLGTIEVLAEGFDDIYTMEVKSSLPEYRFVFGNVKFEYDLEDKNALRGAAVAMTTNANPVFFPSGDKKEMRGECMEHLGGAVGAKIGFAVAPETKLRECLKKICKKIDPEKGIVSPTGGPWALDTDTSFGDYTILSETTRDYIANNMEYFKEIGVDQIDFHQGPSSFRQGDFKFARYESAEEFRQSVTTLLQENGIEAGLHTYAHYIKPECYDILTNPEWQKQLDEKELFTLAQDISAEDTFVPTVESTAELSDYYGFFTNNLPYFLIGEEIVKYTNDKQGFAKCERGFAGTKAVPHKKGEIIHHLNGCFCLFSPKANSELFKKIARDTAIAYNEGGFAMIYLDALDGMDRQCNRDEVWYYCAVFVHEIMKICKKPPIIEYSTNPASIWAARARMGAWDTPFRAYKEFHKKHHKANEQMMRSHYACTLGWYSFYPLTEGAPGNQHTKYHHWDAIDNMGALAVMYNYSNVFDGHGKDLLARYAGYRRNIARYKMYSDLRKEKYFSESILKKARANKNELAIINKDGKFVFVEKSYDTKRYFDIENENRCTSSFKNPFEEQTPFIRLEADMSTLSRQPITLMTLDETKPLSEQKMGREYGIEFNLTQNMAFKVRVLGNGKKGAVALKLRCNSGSEFGYALYIIETNFKGWRDFVLCEVDNGERPDWGFDKGEHLYPIYRSGYHFYRTVKAELLTDGDTDGVRMSSITACHQSYNVVKNPSIKINGKKLTFECDLMSTDFIEWDGKEAKVIDRYANEKPIAFSGSVTVPRGKYLASVGIEENKNACPVNLHLTVGTTGKELK